MMATQLFSMLRRTPKAVEEGKECAEKSEARYYWMALFGFFILFSETGVRQVMNVFVPFIIEEYNCTKIQADTAAIVAPSATSLIAGPLAAFIYQLFGARIGITVGSTFCFSGFVLGSFSGSIYTLYCNGFLIGIGCALMRNCIISVMCEYFTEKRNFVMAFISIGPGIGVFVLPRIIMPLISALSWKGTWQVLSVLYIICFAMAIFITKKPSRAHGCADLLGITVWKHGDFLFHAMASFCASSVVVIYLSNILSLMKFQEIENPEHIYSYQGIASIFGRALLTIVMWKTKIHIAIIMIFNYGIAQISLFSALFCYNIWEFRAQNFFSGIGMGMFNATLAPFLCSIVGPSHLPSALGYTNLINGLAAFAAIRVAGAVVGFYDTPRAAFVLATVAGSLAVIFAVVNSAVILLRDRKLRKSSVHELSRRNSEELKALRRNTISEH